jgi:hypothetical protein
MNELEFLITVNLICNILLSTSIILFIISVFGRSDHFIWENKYRAYMAKFGLGFTACGALLHVTSSTIPTINDVIFNAALAFNFCWLAWWQVKAAKYEKEIKSKEKIKLQAPKSKKIIAKKTSRKK